jgi:hypothetical protein
LRSEPSSSQVDRTERVAAKKRNRDVIFDVGQIRQEFDLDH